MQSYTVTQSLTRVRVCVRTHAHAHTHIDDKRSLNQQIEET